LIERGFLFNRKKSPKQKRKKKENAKGGKKGSGKKKSLLNGAESGETAVFKNMGKHADKWRKWVFNV